MDTFLSVFLSENDIKNLNIKDNYIICFIYNEGIYFNFDNKELVFSFNVLEFDFEINKFLIFIEKIKDKIILVNCIENLVYFNKIILKLDLLKFKIIDLSFSYAYFLKNLNLEIFKSFINIFNNNLGCFLADFLKKSRENLKNINISKINLNNNNIKSLLDISRIKINFINKLKKYDNLKLYFYIGDDYRIKNLFLFNNEYILINNLLKKERYILFNKILNIKSSYDINGLHFRIFLMLLKKDFCNYNGDIFAYFTKFNTDEQRNEFKKNIYKFIYSKEKLELKTNNKELLNILTSLNNFKDTLYNLFKNKKIYNSYFYNLPIIDYNYINSDYHKGMSLATLCRFIETEIVIKILEYLTTITDYIPQCIIYDSFYFNKEINKSLIDNYIYNNIIKV